MIVGGCEGILGKRMVRSRNFQTEEKRQSTEVSKARKNARQKTVVTAIVLLMCFVVLWLVC